MNVYRSALIRMKLPCSKKFLVTRLILHQAIGCVTSILSRCFLSLCWQEDAMWMLSEIQCLKLFSIIIVGDIFKHNTVTFLDRVRSFRRNNNSEVLDKLFFPQQFTNDFKEDDSRTIVKKKPSNTKFTLSCWLSRQGFHTHKLPQTWGWASGKITL